MSYAKRRKQIDTLKMFNENVIEIKENSEYRVDFTVGCNEQMSLNIILGADYPSEKPAIVITPETKHPWVVENTNHVSNAPGLLNYSEHSDLGQIVQVIVREFKNFYSKLLNASINGETSLNGSKSPSHSKTNKCERTPDEMQLLTNELNEMSIDELRELLFITDFQDSYIYNQPDMIKLEQEKAKLMDENEKICKDNLTQAELMDELRKTIREHVETLTALKQNYEAKNSKHIKKLLKYDPTNIRSALHRAALEADSKAESVAQQFLNGDVDVDTFMVKYFELRTLGQLRRAKEELFSEQLAQLQRAKQT